jgi:hypothetical protein
MQFLRCISSCLRSAQIDVEADQTSPTRMANAPPQAISHDAHVSARGTGHHPTNIAAPSVRRSRETALQRQLRSDYVSELHAMRHIPPDSDEIPFPYTLEILGRLIHWLDDTSQPMPLIGPHQCTDDALRQLLPIVQALREEKADALRHLRVLPASGNDAFHLGLDAHSVVQQENLVRGILIHGLQEHRQQLQQQYDLLNGTQHRAPAQPRLGLPPRVPSRRPAGAHDSVSARALAISTNPPIAATMQRPLTEAHANLEEALNRTSAILQEQSDAGIEAHRAGKRIMRRSTHILRETIGVAARSRSVSRAEYARPSGIHIGIPLGPYVPRNDDPDASTLA